MSVIRGNTVGTPIKPEKNLLKATDLTEEEKAQARSNVGLGTFKEGTGEKSVVIGDGNAIGDYSIAGGTNDKDLVGDLIGSDLLAAFANVDPAVAEGDMSLSYGAGTKAITAGSITVGALSKAGCKGFYWHSFDFTNKYVFLSTEQKPYYKVGVEFNKTPTWNTDAANILSNWKVGDTINIMKVTSHRSLCSKITAIDSANGVVTVDSLPFTADDVKITTTLGFDFQDCSVCNPYRPEYGVAEIGLGALAHGAECTSAGMFSQAYGYGTMAADNFAHAEGRDTTAIYAAHAEGRDTKALGEYAHAEGNTTTASNYAAHSEGSKTIASGDSSHAEGRETTATNINAHAEGKQTTASGPNAHAEGDRTIASGQNSHAEGCKTEASGFQSHAEGHSSIASNSQAHAEGISTVASGNSSHAEGSGTIAASSSQHVQGKYNIEDSANVYAHIVGNGKDSNNRSNAHTVDWNGNGWFAGGLTLGANNLPVATEDFVRNLVNSSGGGVRTESYALPAHGVPAGLIFAIATDEQGEFLGFASYHVEVDEYGNCAAGKISGNIGFYIGTDWDFCTGVYVEHADESVTGTVIVWY